MKVELFNLKGDSLPENDFSLSEDLFSSVANAEIIKSVVDWQNRKAGLGTHKVKNVSEVSGTGKKPHAQKGSGRARKATLRAVQMRGGCVVHGPRGYKGVVNKPPKKVRKMALLHTLSNKFSSNKTIFLDSFDLTEISTKFFCKFLKKMNVNSAFICVDKNSDKLILSARNIPNVKVVYSEGLNVYDLVKYDYFITSKSVIESLQESWKKK